MLITVQCTIYDDNCTLVQCTIYDDNSKDDKVTLGGKVSGQGGDTRSCGANESTEFGLGSLADVGDYNSLIYQGAVSAATACK